MPIGMNTRKIWSSYFSGARIVPSCWPFWIQSMTWRLSTRQRSKFQPYVGSYSIWVWSTLVKPWSSCFSLFFNLKPVKHTEKSSQGFLQIYIRENLTLSLFRHEKTHFGQVRRYVAQLALKNIELAQVVSSSLDKGVAFFQWIFTMINLIHGVENFEIASVEVSVKII